MIRVVLDTNVVVSSNLRIDGISAAILDLAVRKKIRMYVSRTVMAEYKEVLNRPRFNLGPQRIARTLSVIRRVSALVKAGRTVVVSEDDPDNRLPECAQAARADYLITGNARHFQRDLKEPRLSPRLSFSNRLSLVWRSASERQIEGLSLVPRGGTLIPPRY